MNATPMNPTSGNAVQPASQAGKPADSGSPEVPFSQVLSSEIAQNRKNDAPRESSDAGTKPDPAARPAGTAEDKADSTQQAKAGEKAARDQDKDKQDATPADDATVAPETFLALGISPDAFKPVTAAAPAASAAIAASAAVTSAAAAAATPEAASVPDAAARPTLGAHGLPVPDARKGRAIPDRQAAQQAGDEHGVQKGDPRLSGKDALPAGVAARTATPAETAAAFQGQLAAARHADAAKTGENLSDLVSNPALRTAPHAPVDALLASADAASPRLAPAVGTTAWGQALGEKLVWMASGTQQTASLTLNPPNLGPLQIVVNVTNDQATASFFSAQPEVRHALEAAFPRLREMMNDAGIQLGQATVSADTPQQNDTPDRQAQRIAPAFLGTDPAAPAGQPLAQAPVRQAGRGLVDTFA